MPPPPTETADARTLPPATPHPAVVAWALALLLGLQPVTTDLYLPALPALKADLLAPMGRAQLTLSGLMLSFGVAQLALGPIADRIGRRPVLLWSLFGYLLAAVGSAMAQSIDAVVAWRVLQGACMAGAVVCARAMVRDLYLPHDGMRVMSKGLSGLGVIALLSPLLGGLIAAQAGWRGTFVALALFAAAVLGFLLWRLPETVRVKNPAATRPGPLLATWRRIGRHPTFVAYSALTACTYAGLFTFLAGSSFVYIEVLHYSRRDYGFVMASSSLAYLAGTFVCRRWLQRHGVRGAVARGGFFTLTGGVAMAGLALAGVVHPWAITIPQWLYVFGHGIHQPCSQVGAVGPFPHHAGAAAALAGFVLALVAFGVGLWLGAAMDGSVRPLTLTLGFWALLTSLVAWTLVQRHGDPAPASVVAPTA
jgi:DHA1 family bicyclomycin/chloramphenicol resistance-like MFS transporter